jgi:hypothetical protein
LRHESEGTGSNAHQVAAGTRTIDRSHPTVKSAPENAPILQLGD